MRKQIKRVRLTSVSLLTLLIASVVVVYQVQAHGAIEVPLSRVYNCYLEGPESPQSEACKAAIAVGGTQQFYDWNEVNRLANGRHREVIPDGQLCSAGNESHKGLDLARDDWPAETIAPDANGNFEFIYTATAHHSTDYFKFYVTKDGYDPLKPLAWSDLEDDPFCTINDVTLENDQYKMTCPLPQDKTGRHVIYNIWQRDDSPEAFYSCSDVIFDDDGTPPVTATPNDTVEPTATPDETAEPTKTTPPTPTPCTTSTPPATATVIPTGVPTGVPTLTPTATPNNAPTITVTSGSIIGAPGSYFIITGRNFPPNTSITLFINGILLADVMTDANGTFTVVIVTTRDTLPGNYQLSTSAPYNAATTITLDEGAPMQQPDPQGQPPLTIPTGVQPTSNIFLPVVQSDASSAIAAREDDPNPPCAPTATPTEPVETPISTPTPADGTPTATSTPVPPGGQDGDKHIIGYYTSWSIYDRDYQVMDIPATQLTHVNYAFAKVSNEGTCKLGDPYADVEKVFTAANSANEPSDGLRGNFGQLRKLKAQHPHLKTLISVGGWTWSDKFSDVALTDESRLKFAQSCVEFMHKYGFNGIDIDWEYPVGGGREGNIARPEDRENFTLLLRTLREQLHQQEAADGRSYLLTIAASAGQDKINNLDLAQIQQYVDWINVMTYDFHGSWEAQTNFNAPLYAPADDPAPDAAMLNVNAAITAYLDRGVPANKLVMGMPFYGHGWARVAATNNGLYQYSRRIPRGTWERGIFDYWDLVENYLDAGYVRYWSDEAQVPWLYSADEHIMISYDDAESIGAKADYLLDNKLAGAMVWELSADLRADLIPANEGASPSLLSVIYKRLRAKPEPTPTAIPTGVPTETPTGAPTTTPQPTDEPTTEPTAIPTPVDTATPVPTDIPTATPVDTPVPTDEPTPLPTPLPTDEPTAIPTATPVPPTATFTPVVPPTDEPTATPTDEPPPTGVDLVIDGLEVTQAIQDVNNSVPLVSGRGTYVRVFARVLNGTADNVTVAITGSRGGQPLGTVDSSQQAVSSSPTRGDASSTFNIALPSNWLSGNVNIQATVDSQGAISEANEGNNTYSLDLTFNNMPAYNVVLVPIDYTHNGTFYPAPTSDNVTSFAWKVWPLAEINVTLRSTPYSFSGNLDSGTDWRRIVNEMRALKSAENAPSSTYYYGLVPIQNADGRWWNGGIAGISGVGSRVGAGLDIGGNTFAHEIGHGFGLDHAPCGVSGDPNYPYPNGSIGQYGFDQEGNVKTPDNYTDLMSYCNRNWVSDYNYKLVYNDQINSSFAQAQSVQSGLLIRADVTQDGVQMGATYALQTYLDAVPANSDYSVQLLNAEGQVIATHAVAATKMIAEPLALADQEAFTQRSGVRLPTALQHSGESISHAIHAAVPMPGTPVAKVRILHQGNVVAERALQVQTAFATRSNTSATRNGDSITLTWPATGIPVTVRFTPDNGASWLTLAVDEVAATLTLNSTSLPNNGQGRYEIVPADSASPTVLEVIGE